MSGSAGLHGGDLPASASSPDLVVVDAGNSHTVFGFYRGATLVRSLRLASDRERTVDELGAVLLPLLDRFGLDCSAVAGVMVASVVPPLTTTLAELSRRYFGRAALFVEPGVKTGMPIRYDNPAEVGADRIVNAVAARERWGAPVVVVDFGTATTFDVVNDKGEYVGGVITPGISISAEALFSHASRLFRVDIRKPERLVARNTAGAIQSGLYWGYVGLVEGILARLASELPGLRAVVATGGQARLIAESVPRIDAVADELTLEGLRLIWERNQ